MNEIEFELPAVPEAIKHLIDPTQVAMSRKEAKAEGKRLYIGSPDKHGCCYRYASCGTGVLEKLHHNREAVASGAQAEDKRRYYATAEGYSQMVVAHARANADKLGVERRPFEEEEEVLADVARFAFSLRKLTGMRLNCHHAIKGIAEHGRHAYSNLVILSAGTHTALHLTARWSHIHPAVLFRRALKAGEIVRVGQYYIEASVMKAASNALLRDCFGAEPPVLYDEQLPALRPAGAPVDDGLPLTEETLAAAVGVFFDRAGMPVPANQNDPLPEVAVA